MKKNILNNIRVFRLISIISLLLVFLIPSCKSDNSNVAVAHNGIVNFVQGDVFIEDEAGSRKLQLGDLVKQNGIVKTVGSKSVCDIYISENVIRINGNSEFKFSKLLKSAFSEKVELELEKGSVFTRVVTKLKKDDEFVIKTPTAVAAVRGTEFSVEQSENGANIACTEGKVAVSDSEGLNEVVINPDEEVQVEKGKGLVKKQISEDRKRALKLIRNIKTLQKDIKKKYKDQKKEIDNKYKEQKKEIKEKVDKQKESDKKMVDKQKSDDKKRVDDIKSTTDDKADESVNKADDAMEKAKTDADKAMDSVQPDTDSVLPSLD